MLSPIKKYLLLVLSVLLVLCASGCGTGHETEKKTAKPEKPKTAGTENNVNSGQAAQNVLVVTINGKKVRGQLNSTPEAKAFKTMLPQKISMTGFGGREYYGPMEKKLEVTSPGRLNFDNGDITYCPTNNSIAIFYAQTNQPNLTMKVYTIGKITDDLSIFHDLSPKETMVFTLENENNNAISDKTPTELVHRVQDPAAPIVYYTKAVNSQGLLKVYEALKQQTSGKVGVKLSFEAPGATHLDPQMLKPLVDKVQGTFIDSNGFTSPRDTTAGNLQVAQEHGFTAVGPVDILDSEGELDLPVVGGKHLKFHRIGAHFANYDTLISIVHFKPHTLRDYGGTIKNLTICLASIGGKGIIHSGGTNTNFSEGSMKNFMESLADACKGAMDYKQGRWAFINVLNNLQVQDSCSDAEQLPDIGILASNDPVAIDSAALDFTYGQAPSAQVRKAWENKHNYDVLQYAEELGVGKRNYRLVEIE